jgi:hypothetical protein
LHPPDDCRLNSHLLTTTNRLFPPTTYITKNRLSHVKLRERRHNSISDWTTRESPKFSAGNRRAGTAATFKSFLRRSRTPCRSCRKCRTNTVRVCTMFTFKYWTHPCRISGSGVFFRHQLCSGRPPLGYESFRPCGLT